MVKRLFFPMLLLVAGLSMTAMSPGHSFAWFGSPVVNAPISTSAGDQTFPQITADGTGGTIIVWQDKRNGNWDIYAQRITAAGAAVWQANGVIVTSAVHDQRNPQIVSDGSGGAIITWEDLSGADSDIYAQRITAGGNALWTANGVPISAAGNDQRNPQIAGDGMGGAIITWEDFRSGTNWDIYARKVDANGNALWTANGIPVSTAGYDQLNPRIASDGSRGAIITWEDLRSGTNSDIYARRIIAEGAAIWTPNGTPVSTHASDQLYPQILSDGSGGVFILWMDNRSGAYTDIYAQHIDSSGAMQLPPDGDLFYTAPNDLLNNYLRITADGVGGAIISWQDRRNTTSDIYAVRIDPLGNIVWSADGVGVCTTVKDQSYPQLVGDGSGGAIIAWQDYRSGTNWDIYAQKVLAGGTLPGAPTTEYDLIAEAGGNGSGRVSSNVGGIDDLYPALTIFSARLKYGTAVTLTAKADTGSAAAWSGICNSRAGTPAAATCTITNMNADKTVAVTFRLLKYALAVTKKGTGAGTVKSDTGWLIWTGNLGTGRFDYNTSVTLTATPAGSSVFSGWTGCDSVSGSTCTVTMNAARSVTAGFALKQYTLSVLAAGNGSGAVKSNVGGINFSYPAAGSAGTDLDHGTIVTLTATAAKGSTVKWSGNCSSTGGTLTKATCTTTINAVKTAKATFTLNRYTLTVTKTGSGSGSITPDTGGLSWTGNIGTKKYNYNTSVILTAAAWGNSTFGGWTGCDSISGNSCTVTMNAAKNVTAAFTLK